MELVYTWVKNIVCFYIFMNIIIHLLPKDSYQIGRASCRERV